MDRETYQVYSTLAYRYHSQKTKKGNNTRNTLANNNCATRVPIKIKLRFPYLRGKAQTESQLNMKN